jgi:hypothetical protein
MPPGIAGNHFAISPYQWKSVEISGSNQQSPERITYNA